VRGGVRGGGHQNKSCGAAAACLTGLDTSAASGASGADQAAKFVALCRACACALRVQAARRPANCGADSDKDAGGGEGAWLRRHMLLGCGCAVCLSCGAKKCSRLLEKKNLLGLWALSHHLGPARKGGGAKVAARRQCGGCTWRLHLWERKLRRRKRGGG